uniref:Transmembrane protein n=1 Tax=Craspedostauros australis TaxID=1486917 RepID=A0A6T6I7T8_9STRA
MIMGTLASAWMSIVLYYKQNRFRLFFQGVGGGWYGEDEMISNCADTDASESGGRDWGWLNSTIVSLGLQSLMVVAAQGIGMVELRIVIVAVEVVAMVVVAMGVANAVADANANALLIVVHVRVLVESCSPVLLFSCCLSEVS